MNIELGPILGKKVLVAVSGGADSMCLLHWLKSRGIDVVAAHYEHGIRGAESERDMRFVQDYCRSNNIPLVLERGDVPAYAREKGMGLEEAARKLRYEFLEQQREILSCDLIATAHNLDDNAETVLMNLIRGSGTGGLSGIPSRRGNILRPLLKVSRAEIEEYLAENFLPHVEDSTNQSDDYTRNLIRHRIMPLIKEINPRFAEAAARTAELSRRDDECLSLLSAVFLSEHEGFEPGADCALLLSAPTAVVSRALRMRLGRLSMEQVDHILDFCRGEGYGELDIPGRRLVRDGGRLYLDPPASPTLGDRPLIPGESLVLPECSLRLDSEICEYLGEVNDLFKTSYLKYEIISSNLRVGARKEGDRLRPMGRGCSKSLKALFLESKYPRHLRDSCPVLRDDEGILLVYGHAVDERARPQIGEKALKITFEKINAHTGE